MREVTVHKAEPYRSGAMMSLGTASYMLIRQFRFPAVYVFKQDQMLSLDSDRLWQHERSRTEKCYARFKVNPMSIEHWVQNAEHERVMEFLKAITGADENVTWSGYRILGTVDGRGYPIWTFQLFAKHPETETLVFSGEDAPNVKQPEPGHDDFLRW